MDIESMRRHYLFGGLSRDELHSDPLVQFRLWFEQLNQIDLPDWFEINAMTLATADPSGNVSSRIVLLKSYDGNGFAFFTNYRSDKAQQLEMNPKAALTFFWPMFERQVRVVGLVKKTPSPISDKYFDSRPEGSRLGAIVSPQSQVIANNDELETRVDELKKQFPGGSIPRPEHWGGYYVSPHTIEFWQGKPSRLHDRFRYRLSENNWIIERLAP